MPMTNEQILAEVKRKAQQGIALSNPNAEKQAVYDQARKATEAEIARKANANIALTNQTSAANNQLYAQLRAAQQSAGAAPPAQATTSSPQSYIDSLTDARRASQIAALDKSKNAALSNLSAERATIQPQYYDARNQVAAGNQQSARNFAEFMAARGGVNAGTNAQAELTRNMSLQGNLGELGRQETAAYQDIARRESDINNAYQSDIASAESGLQADRMNLLLQDYYKAQDRGDRLTQQAIENKFAQAGIDLQTAGLTGVYKGQQTLAAKGQAFDQNMANKQFNFTKSQQEWENNFKQGQFDWQKAQQTWENTFQEKNFQQQMQEAAASRGLQWASLNQRQKEFVADQAFRDKQFQYQMQQDNKPQVQTAEDYSKYIDSSPYFGKDMDGNPVITDKNAVESMILQSGLPDAEMSKLYARYGIPMN